jgi:hypothetical protein
MSTQIPEIKSIMNLLTNNGSALIGLGVDNKTYYWSYDKGEWTPNWHIPAPVPPIPANVAAALERATSKKPATKKRR